MCIQLLAMILSFILLYRYIDIIELPESANHNNPFLLRFAIQSGLKGVATDRLSRQSFM